MGKIRMLSDSLIGKIAAGEVVERPVSALKELVENSLDAGASAVTAEIREGGLSYIRVTDNGCGIEESDLRLAFERHATSKISKEPDLFSIQTLGFRGEALASIAAVSHVVMTTRTVSNDTGLKVTNEGGRIQKIEEAACTVGTTITVTDLFFNTPVRRGFMKKASTEATAVYELMSQFILSRPDVSFRYVNDGKTILHSPGDGQLASAALTVFGAKAVKTMKTVNGHANGILLNGYIGIGENARGNRGQEYFFINGRYLQSSLLSTAVEEGTRERVMIGHFPMCILHLTMPYDSVDVNVHPNKLQVRFRKEAEIEAAVASIVKDALTDRDVFSQPEVVHLTEETHPQSVVTSISTILPEPPSQPAWRGGEQGTESAWMPKEASGRKNDQILESSIPVSTATASIPQPVTVRPAVSLSHFDPSQLQKPAGPSQTGSQPEVRTEETFEPISFIPNEEKKQIRLIGNVFKTYILLEYDDQLVMIDQHAAHERLNFDAMMQAYDQHRAGQELLVPIIVKVTPKEQDVLEAHRELLEQLGLVIEPFGENEMAIRSIPMILGQPQTQAFFRELLDELSGEPHGFTLEKRRTAILQTACKHSVKGGETLSEDDMRYLVEQLVDRHVTPTCPHGRPLGVALSHTELDRKFRRIQPD